MRDSSSNVIYIGKANNLRNRVVSYFSSIKHDPKTQQLVTAIVDFDFYVVPSEEEALVLENNLIKRFKPHYNIRLKDDKGFPYIKIDLSETWPRVQIVRSISSDGARYFGPFANQQSIRRTLDVVKSLFPFRSCNAKLVTPLPRPCLEFHMHRCLAPCVGKATSAEYSGIIQNLILFLEGKQVKLMKSMRQQMNTAAAALQFERAAWIRNQLKSVEQALSWQKLATKAKGNKDVIAFAVDRNHAAVQVFFVRDNKLIGRDIFTLTNTEAETQQQIMSDFIQQYYAATTSIPPQIHLQHAVKNKKVLQNWLSSRRGSTVTLKKPLRGPSADLMRTVEQNATKGLEQLRIKNLAQPKTLVQALEEVKDRLKLAELPHRIEGYDVSNTQGKQAVASMVVFKDGIPQPALYRRFRIKTVEGPNDFAMLAETITRRFSHTHRTPSDTLRKHPNLVLVDGGKGQLSAARKAMIMCGVEGIPTIGLAKANEEVFSPSSPNPIVLPLNSPGLQLLQRVRDEAHRYALGYHTQIRKKEAITSELDSVPGIGPKRRKELLSCFGTVGRIKQATIEELTRVTGISDSIARSLKIYL